MKNEFEKKLCAIVVCTFLLVLSSSFSYANNVKRVDGLTEEVMIAAFELVDLNDDGFISASEYKTFLLTQLIFPDDEEIDGLIALFDVDADAQINYEEFSRLVIDGFGPFLPFGGIL